MFKIVLVTPFEGEELIRIVDAFQCDEVTVLTSLSHVEQFDFGADHVLVTYGTGVIIPASVLRRLQNTGYNFHPGPPEYPGLNPHFFASYNEVSTYGATAHILWKSVDSGPIVGVEISAAPPNASPIQLLDMAVDASFRLLQRVAPRIARGDKLQPLDDVRWGKKRYTQLDAIMARRLSPAHCFDEIDHRRRSFATRKSKLSVQLGDFRFEHSEVPYAAGHSDEVTSFTESRYTDLLRRLQATDFQVVTANEFFTSTHKARVVSLIHPVGYSPHRAAAVSRIASSFGLQGSFFVTDNSMFFDPGESSVQDCLSSIVQRRHTLGLFADNIDAVEMGQRRPVEWAQLLSKCGSSLTNGGCIVGETIEFYCNGQSLIRNDYPRVVLYKGRWWLQVARGQNWMSYDIERVGELALDRLLIVCDPVWCPKQPLSPLGCMERCVMGRARAAFREIGANSLSYNVDPPGWL